MCRMLGVVYKGGFPKDALTDLKKVSETGKIPDEEKPGHRDGWGIASFQRGSPFYIGRSDKWAAEDPAFESAFKGIDKLSRPNIVIAHVRALSHGVASIPNTHPFIMDGLVLGHNGTLDDFRPVTRHKPKGETDSEILIALLADRMDETKNLRSAVRSLIKEDVADHEFSALILMISDGKKLYAYRDYGRGRSPDYYNLRIARVGDGIIMFQETRLKYECELPTIRKGELVIVDLDLNIEREMLL
jgi:predicted glutamine amidotransferase